MSPARVSVIVPTRDRASLLGQALDSIFAQTRPPDEVIVVDDGSRDATPALLAARKEPLALLQTPGLGPAAARNAGLAAARGDIVAFLDSDDLWPPDSLALQLAELRRPPAADAVWGLTRVVDLETMGAAAPAGGELRQKGSVCAMLFRAEVLRALGGFCAQLRYGEDAELLLRARAKGVALRSHAGVALIHRRHDGNLTNDADADRRAWFDIARLNRRRRAQSA